MRYALFLGLILLASTSVVGQTKRQVLIQSGKLDKISSNKPQITNDEVIQGLREALTNGAKTAVSSGSMLDGFYKNQLIFIPWPPEANAMKDKLSMLGMQGQITKFEESMNRAAEEAAKSAFDVFSNAVLNMSVTDGFAILKGGDTAATNYLRNATVAELTEKFKPIVIQAMVKVKVSEYWNPLITKYNKIPGVQKLNPDIEAYVTAKAINGLMLLISQQETKIRQDPAAQTTALLQRVFGKG